MFSAVIFTPGRTGSQLILHNLIRYFKCAGRNSWETNVTNGCVVHSHNPLYNPPSPEFICVVSKRNDMFASILSKQIGRKTDEFVYYSNKVIEPFTVALDQFTDNYYYSKCFYKSIDYTRFKSVVEIEYESLINDPTYLFSMFDVNVKTEYTLPKSPYKYQDLILNIEELKELYLKLEATDITTELLENFKLNIVNDLEDIRLNHNGNKNSE